MDKKNIEAIYPLTSMQQTLLLHAIQNPKQDLGFLQIQFDIRGTLDVTELKQAWQSLLTRHQVLRTAIYWENLEQPLQIVQRQVQPIWEFLDWRQLSKEAQKPKEAQKLKIKNLKSTALKQGLSLNNAPLAHVSLIQQADDHYHFICHCHHILLDGWSGNLIVTELFSLYQAKYQLPKAFKFQDYVNWVQQRDTDLAKKFWENQLKGSSREVVWPARITTEKVGYDKQSLTIKESTTQQIQQLCSANKITLNTFFQGVWTLLLSTYSQDNEVVFGITVSGRAAQLKGLENAIGMFSNVLPLHSKINQQESLIPWLQSLAVQQAEISNFDYITLAQIQTWRSTNFRSLFVFENHAQENLFTSDALTVTGYESGLTSNYPLTVAIQPGDEVIVTIVYDTGYLQEKQVAELLKNWQQLIAQSIAEPQQELSTLVQKIRVKAIKESTSNLASTTDTATRQSLNAESTKPETKPKTPVEIALANIWMEILNQQESSNTDHAENEIIKVVRDDSFFDLGGRSIMAAFLINRIQDTFQVRLPLYRLFEYPTLEKLSTFIQSQKGFQLPSMTPEANGQEANNCLPFTPYTQQKSWNLEQEPKENKNLYLSLVPIQPKGTKPPLFCVPPAGNTALTYVNLANHLDKEQPIYGLNPLGLEDGSKPHYSVEEMASHYLTEIQSFQPKGPYHFAGTCFGGQVAFEMAQQVKAQGNTVQLLALFDPVAPRIIRYKYFIHLLKREKSPIAIISYIVSRLYRRLKTKRSSQSSNESERSPEEERLENLMEAHSSAMRHYVPKIYAGDITIFRSGENYKLENKEIGHLAVPWSDYTMGKYNYHVIPGVHADMIAGGNLNLMAGKLKACLDGL